MLLEKKKKKAINKTAFDLPVCLQCQVPHIPLPKLRSHLKYSRLPLLLRQHQSTGTPRPFHRHMNPLSINCKPHRVISVCFCHHSKLLQPCSPISALFLIPIFTLFFMYFFHYKILGRFFPSFFLLSFWKLPTDFD